MCRLSNMTHRQTLTAMTFVYNAENFMAPLTATEQNGSICVSKNHVLVAILPIIASETPASQRQASTVGSPPAEALEAWKRPETYNSLIPHLRR